MTDTDTVAWMLAWRLAELRPPPAPCPYEQIETWRHVVASLAGHFRALPPVQGNMNAGEIRLGLALGHPPTRAHVLRALDLALRVEHVAMPPWYTTAEIRVALVEARQALHLNPRARSALLACVLAELNRP